jgi:hypothetical protein
MKHHVKRNNKYTIYLFIKTQATEMELKDTSQAYLEKYPQHETIYIKICDNTVRIDTTIHDIELLENYPKENRNDKN